MAKKQHPSPNLSLIGALSEAIRTPKPTRVTRETLLALPRSNLLLVWMQIE